MCGFTSRAKPNKAAMASGDAMKKAVSMIRVKTNRNKVLGKCTPGMRFEYEGERQQTIARAQEPAEKTACLPAERLVGRGFEAEGRRFQMQSKITSTD
ncbi:hypothetical protein PSP6_610019 [Paraburkholderia tropica]|nr:hypothetical protein PSP6_610019 [Paraburkholderia tropica]